MPIPKPGTQAFEDMIDFMRADLDSGMGYSKIIQKGREIIEADGRNFDEEFEKWKASRKKQ